MLSKFLLSTTAVLLFSTHVLAAKPDTSEKTAKDDPYILMEKIERFGFKKNDVFSPDFNNGCNAYFLFKFR